MSFCLRVIFSSSSSSSTFFFAGFAFATGLATGLVGGAGVKEVAVGAPGCAGRNAALHREQRTRPPGGDSLGTAMARHMGHVTGSAAGAGGDSADSSAAAGTS